MKNKKFLMMLFFAFSTLAFAGNGKKKAKIIQKTTTVKLIQVVGPGDEKECAKIANGAAKGAILAAPDDISFRQMKELGDMIYNAAYTACMRGF